MDKPIFKKRGGCHLNKYSNSEVFDIFMQCNSSESWCYKMVESRPFVDDRSVLELADKFWRQSSEEDLIQAFEGHPEIGDVSTLREKYKDTAKLAGDEQSGVNTATENTLHLLAQGNKDYKEKFGFIFIVCARGKSADEMLDLLLKRLANSREQELVNAALEQGKITLFRLEALFGRDFSPPP
jgi:2-oxo-4-hydroxy-4-carboxy-5-ureidoimidazoline decarboxylase